MKNTGSLNISKPYTEPFDSDVNTISTELTHSEKVCQNAGTHTEPPHLMQYVDVVSALRLLVQQNKNSKEPVLKCRYVVTFIGFLIYLSAGMHSTLMSVSIVDMVNNTAIIRNSTANSESCPNLLGNSTDDATLHSSRIMAAFDKKLDLFYGNKKKFDQAIKGGEFLWSPETQGYILGCYFFGHIFSLIPSGRLAEKFGCKWIIVGALITISILTMLIPPSSRLNVSAVIVIQTLRGFAQGVPEPCITILMANWCPKSERGFLYAIIQTSNSLGPALGHIFAGYISESPGGWPYAFYTIGGSGLALAASTVFFIAESPREHPRITKAELNFILSQQESKLSRRRPKLPWRQMLTSIPFYALIFVIFGRYWKFSQFWIVHSTFLGTTLHYSTGQNGLFSAIPFLLSFLTSTTATWISRFIEKKKTVSIDFLRKFWIVTAGLLYSSCLLGTYIAGCNRDVSVIFSVLSMGLSGLGTPGALVVVQDMSPTFSGTLHSITATIGFMASVILPLIVGYLTDERQTLEQWNKVFFISIGIVMSSTITFLIFGSAKIQPWNFVEEEDKVKDKRRPGNDEKVEATRF